MSRRSRRTPARRSSRPSDCRTSVVDRYFTGTTSKLGGVGLDVIAEEVAQRHRRAYPVDGIPPAHRKLDIGGEYQWRREGEPHLFDPDTVFRLQHSTRVGPLRHLQAVHQARRRPVRAADDAARAVLVRRGTRRRSPIDEVEPVSEIVKRFSTGAMSYGSISLEAHETLAIAMNQLGGEVQHRRGRRGLRPAAGPGAAQRDQAGGVGSVRRDQRVPHERRRHPDQDGAGRQARRRRPAAGPQGLPVGRQDPALDAGRRPDLAAAAPRHLLDRGPGPADPRPEERQPVRAHPREARLRGRRRHGGGRCLQGARRRRTHLRPRRRHRRLAADVAQARGRSVGARPGRDPADAAAQRAARPDRRAVRRPAQDRPRRDHRGAARRGGVRLRDGAAGRVGLRHDARLPPRHLSGRHRDAEPGAARALHRQGRVRRQLLPVHRRGGARAACRAGLPHVSPRRSATPRSLDTRKAVEHWKASGPRPDAGAARAGAARRARRGTRPSLRTTASTGRSTTR